MLPASLLSLFRGSRARLLVAAVAFTLLCAAESSGQTDSSGQAPPVIRKKSLSDQFGDVYVKAKTLADNGQMDEALAVLNSVIPTMDPESYDTAFFMNTKARLLVQKEDMAGAVEPWETAIRLSDKYNYFNRDDTNEIIHYLSQIYFQLGANIKFPPKGNTQGLRDLQREDFTKAIAYTRRWMASQRTLNQDDEETYANELYNLAVVDPDKPDNALLLASEQEAKKGLGKAIHPREQLYELLVLIYQQQGDMNQLANYLELLAKLKPDSKAYWPQLMSVYLNLAGAADKDKARARPYYARAILSIERAQAHGQMNDPKNNYNLVSIYYSVGQYAKAAELLSAGLKNNTIESTEQNWRVLAYCYQQFGEDLKAIQVYKDAEDRLPPSGKFDYYIAQIYTGLDKEAEAFDYYRSAVEKGGLPEATAYSAYLSIAITGYELHKFEDALKACDEAAKFPEAAKYKQLSSLRQGIVDEVQNEKPSQPAAPTESN